MKAFLSILCIVLMTADKLALADTGYGAPLVKVNIRRNPTVDTEMRLQSIDSFSGLRKLPISSDDGRKGTANREIIDGNLGSLKAKGKSDQSTSTGDNVLDMTRNLFEENIGQMIDKEMNKDDERNRHLTHNHTKSKNEHNSNSANQIGKSNKENNHKGSENLKTKGGKHPMQQKTHKKDHDGESSTHQKGYHSDPKKYAKKKHLKGKGTKSKPKKKTKTAKPDRSKYDVIFINKNDRAEHLSNYYKISKRFNKLETRFKRCLADIVGGDYSEAAVERCLGKDLSKVLNSVKYEKYKLLSMVEEKINRELFQHCYHRARNNTLFAYGCDLLSKDIIDLLWREFNYFDIVANNKEKYIFEHSVVPFKVFHDLMVIIKFIYEASSDLLEKIHSQKDGLVFNLKKEVDMKTKVILEHAIHTAKQHKKPVVNQKINITEFYNSPYNINLTKLPNMRVIDNIGQFNMPNEDVYSQQLTEEFKAAQSKIDVINKLTPNKLFAFSSGAPNLSLTEMNEKRDDLKS